MVFREKFSHTEFFLFVFSCIRTEYGDLVCKSPDSVQMRENADQKKLRIWTLFTQCGITKAKPKNRSVGDNLLFATIRHFLMNTVF